MYTEQIRDQENLFKLFRDHMEINGGLYTTKIALNSFIESLKLLKAADVKDMKEQISGLLHTVRCSKPRITPLISMFEHCKEGFDRILQQEGRSPDEIRETLIAEVEKNLSRISESIEKVSDNGKTHVADGDFIIIHSVSTILGTLLRKAKADGKDFKVLLLKQDPLKTNQVEKQLSEADIAYVVAPEYSFVHFMDQATKLFLGALAVTEDDKVVCSTGTAGIVSIAHLNHLPVYLFVSPLSFSDQKCCDHNIHRKEELVCDFGIEHKEISHSNDVVDICLMDHIISEEGKMDAEMIQRRFQCRI